MPAARRQRPTSPSATATTALALLAVAVAMAARPALVHAHARNAPTEARHNASETQVIRDVAQAVVAAARQLVGAERFVPDVAVPAEFVATSTVPTVIVNPSQFDIDSIGFSHISNEPLLDLPPPAC